MEGKEEDLIQHIKDKVDMIYSIVVGHEQDQESGMIKRLQNNTNETNLLKERVKVLEDASIKQKAYIAALIAVGFVFGFIAKALFSLFLDI